MSEQRYPEEFKTEAVKQITEGDHKVADVSARLGVSRHSLYQWIKAHLMPVAQRQTSDPKKATLRRGDPHRACLCLFEPGLKLMVRVTAVSLFDLRTVRLHRAVVDAVL